MAPPGLPQETKDRVVTLPESGMAPKDIAAELSISPGGARNVKREVVEVSPDYLLNLY